MTKMRKAIYKGEATEGHALLARAPTLHVATTGANGQPILRVVHTVLDEAGGELLVAFHGAPAGEKMEGLGRAAVLSYHEVIAEIPSWFLDPELACPATTYYVSVQAEGVLEEVTDLETKARLLQALMTKYQPEGRHVPIRGDDPLYTKQVAGLLVAGVRVHHLAYKTKLGQNRKRDERVRVIENLWRRGASGDVRAVDFLTRRFPDLAPSFLRVPELGLRFEVAVNDDEIPEVMALLEGAYWLTNVPADKQRAAIRASTCAVLARDEKDGKVVAFARAVSDGRVAWIYDVMVRADLRGKSAGTALMRFVLDHPAVRDALVVRLSTKDAKDFYERLGFVDTATAHAEQGRSWRPTEMAKVSRTFRRDPSHQSPIRAAGPA